MAIALSVPLVPSRLLRRLTVGYGLACLGMGAAAAAGWLGPRAWAAATVGACLLAGVALLRTSRRAATVRTLALFGPGALVLTVQQGVAPPRHLRVRLLADSTLWAGLLVPRFDLAPPLVLFADSVPPGQFRRLSMALRALAARPREGAEKYYKNL